MEELQVNMFGSSHSYAWACSILLLAVQNGLFLCSMLVLGVWWVLILGPNLLRSPCPHSYAWACCSLLAVQNGLSLCSMLVLGVWWVLPMPWVRRCAQCKPPTNTEQQHWSHWWQRGVAATSGADASLPPASIQPSGVS